MKHKESEYYKELKRGWEDDAKERTKQTMVLKGALDARNYWTWERIHKMGRNSADGGVRMLCEKLAVKVAKKIPLLDNDVSTLNRLRKSTNETR